MKEDVELFKLITYYMLKIGFQARNSGYRYLRDAVLIGYNDSELLGAVTKRLYPVLAKRYDVSVFQVESSIRNTIELAWEEGDQRELRACLGESFADGLIRPTNSEVIERLVVAVAKLKNIDCD